MVKFSKELEAQLIPEWKEAFLNYWQLKKQIKRIRLSRKPKQSPHDAPFSDFFFSIFDPIRHLAAKLSSRFRNSTDNTEPVQVEIKPVQAEEEEEEEEDAEETYETELLQLFSEEDEVKYFFERLDEEIEKVSQFYKAKEAEFLERADVLNKQFQILLDLKRMLNNRRRKNSSNATSLSSFNSSSTRNSGLSDNTCNDCEVADHIAQTVTDEIITTLEKNGVNFIGFATRLKTKNGKARTALRIDIPATTPIRGISTAMSGLWEDLINCSSFKKNAMGDFINKRKIQCAEKMIRGAFVEFYRGIGLLKTYRSLNMIALTKILKKFDKVADRQASGDYLKRVKGTHFINSDTVGRLMDQVESSFTRHFADNDRKKAMKFLQLQPQKDSHSLTFFVGLFTGCFVTLFIMYAILVHLSGMFSHGGPTIYMETFYPVFSMFALMSLHLFMYGCNLFTWKATRINYNFIFEISPKTSLKSRSAFLLCTSFMTLVVGAMVLHLILESSGFPTRQLDALPGILLLVFIALLICPINIFYRQTRYFFLGVLRNIVFSPFCKVVMVDFFMADQLTSQIPLLRHMETTTCYLLAGSFKTHRYEACHSGRLYRQFAYAISFAPYYWRAMQCARRWFDESDPNQLANLGKYVSAMVAAGARLTYAQQPTYLWMIIVLVTSVAATIYQLYWDFVKDWGFLNPNSRNPWLRDDLILKNKFIYYISIAVNVFLRVAWVETVMRFNIGMIESRLLDFSLASLEVIRRCHWNFYRIENEHLNNVGKFRAVKAVPLPFRETDADG